MEKDTSNSATNFYQSIGVEGLREIAEEYVQGNKGNDTEIIENFLNHEDDTLDLGCGYGRTAVPLAKNGYKITGIDSSEKLINEARRYAKEEGVDIKLDVGDMRDLPYENESFDKVFSLWNTFNHLLTKKEQLNTLNEIYRVLKPEGRAFLETVNGELKAVEQLLKKQGNRIFTFTYKGNSTKIYMHDRNSLKRLCKESKFKDYTVGFKNINKKRRIVVTLEKDNGNK